MIVLIAIDNQAGSALSALPQVMRFKFPDNTDFRLNEPRPGWIRFTDPLGNKHYYFQEAYIIGIMADDEPVVAAEIKPPEAVDLPLIPNSLRRDAGY